MKNMIEILIKFYLETGKLYTNNSNNEGKHNV